jgi:glycosyltransferase involved in cell wall biosynthesis
MSTNFPLVCICIPTYNVADTIIETLESVLCQTYPNFIVHISDNASTDGTLARIASIPDPRVVVHANADNVGGEGNFNRCIELGQGEFTAIFHADDIYLPNMIESQVKYFLDHPKAGAVCTAASLIDETGREIGSIDLPKDIPGNNGLYDFNTMFKAVLRHSNFFVCPSFMFRTSILQREIRSWRGDLFGSSADLDVWLRILRHHPIGHLPEHLIRYRISSKQFSALVRIETAPAAIFAVLKHYLEDEWVRAQIDPVDILNYRRLERRDRFMRAINLVLVKRPDEASQLLGDIFSRDAFFAAFQSRRGAIVFLGGVTVKFLLFLRLQSLNIAALAYLKKVTRK